MRSHDRITSAAFAAALVLVPATAAQTGAEKAALAEPYSLTRAVPGDVFIVTGGRHNPERAFLEAHWNRVYEAFQESGVTESLIDLALSGVDLDLQAEVERVKGRCEELSGAVDWTALGQGEIVFAERLSELLMVGDDVIGAPPEAVMLFRVDEAVAEAQFKALGDSFQAFVEEVNHFTGIGWTLARTERDGYQTVALDFLQGQEGAAPLPLTLGRLGGVLSITFGRTIGAEVGALLTGEAQGSIGDAERFRSGFEGLPAAEDGFEYFDMRNLTRGMRKMFDTIGDVVESHTHGDQGEGGSQEWAMANAVFDRMLLSMNVIDTATTVHFTEGASTYTESITTLSADAETNPVYPLVMSSANVDDFAHFLPVETDSFTVTGGTDLDALYTFLLDTVRVVGPPGEAILARWDGIQQQFGFDVRRDVTGWIEGTSVEATFALEGKDAWISLMKVKDDAMATEKIAQGLAFLQEKLPELAREMPPLAMFTVRAKPTKGEDLVGFTDVAIGPMPQPAAVGVHDGWLVVGSSADAVRRVMATAAGEHDNVRKNQAMMAKAMVPEGAAQTVTFTQHADGAEAAAAMVAGMSMAGGMVSMAIPDPQARDVIINVMEILNELAPVIEEIDFYDTSSSSTTFDGKRWHARSVTHYVPAAD